MDVAGLLSAVLGATPNERLELRLSALRRDPKGIYGTWALYLRRLTDGLPDLPDLRGQHCGDHQLWRAHRSRPRSG